MFDLTAAAAQMNALVTGVRDDQLEAPTPCSEWQVSDLLAHVHQFASVFTSNARKEPVDPPMTLVADWRSVIPGQLEDLARAWREEPAWDGRVSAGGVEMSAEDNAVVAVEELTVHGWDLARATGQQFDTTETDLDQIDRFFDLFGRGPFGPPVQAPAGARRLDQTLARTGRDPRWTP